MMAPMSHDFSHPAGRVGEAGLIVLQALLLCACRAPTHPVDETSQRQMIALLMPRRIEIVKPFTRLKSFDDDPVPDGIELLVRAINALDSPGIMVGHVRVELYEYAPASAEPKGHRLEHWDIDLTSPEDQRRYWNALTQMYEFRLGVDAKAIPRADRYVLLVTYDSPLGERLTDQYLIHYRIPGSPLGGAGQAENDAQTAGPGRGRR